jgi:hypothetical protein
MIISLFFLSLGCSSDSSSTATSTPIKVIETDNIHKTSKANIIKDERVDSIDILFESSIPVHSVTIPGLEENHIKYVESILNLIQPMCFNSLRTSNIQFAEYLGKRDYGSLCLQDRFLLFLVINETKKIMDKKKDNNKSTVNLSQGDVEEIIDNTYHPFSSINTQYKWSEDFLLTLYVPLKGKELFFEVKNDLVLSKDEINIIDAPCRKVDITCNKNAGSWEINGFVFKGPRSVEQLNQIINIHRTYQKKFYEYDQKYYQSR